MTDGGRNLNGRLDARDGINEIKTGSSKKGAWTLYGGSVTVDSKKYNLRAGFNDEGKDKLEDMLSGLMVGDMVDVLIEKNKGGYDEVTHIEVASKDKVTGRVPEGTPVTAYSNTNANKQTVKHEVFNCKFEDIKTRLAAIGEIYNVFATQPMYRPTQDDFVFICYYKD